MVETSRRSRNRILPTAAVPLAALALLVLGAPAAAQEAPSCSYTAQGEELTQRLSPPDSTTARLDGGVAKVCFSSPRMRGREVFGGLVSFGQPWRLGANEPTVLHVTTPVRLGEVALEPGSYSLYTVPGQEEWKIVVNASVSRWGVPIDEAVREQDVGSVTVTPRRTERPVEAMDLRLEPRDDGGANLVMEWAQTRFSVPIRPTGETSG